MTKFNDLRKVGDSLKGAGVVARALGAARTVAQTTADEAGLLNRKGKLSKPKLVKAAVRPMKTGRQLLSGVAKGIEGVSLARLEGPTVGSVASSGKGTRCFVCGCGVSDALKHCTSHAVLIEKGEGRGSYTWECSCGPADGYWPSADHAGAGLAVHLSERHGIRVF